MENIEIRFLDFPGFPWPVRNPDTGNTLAIREDKYKCIEKARVSSLFNLMSAPYFARYESKEVGW